MEDPNTEIVQISAAIVDINRKIILDVFSKVLTDDFLFARTATFGPAVYIAKIFSSGVLTKVGCLGCDTLLYVIVRIDVFIAKQIKIKQDVTNILERTI